MCFSATASFVAAAVTGTIGAICLTRANGPRELPLAATPLMFAVQQALEGFLWLDVHAGGGSAGGGLALAYLIFAETLWPVYAPLAVLLVEPGARRRRLMLPWLALGTGVAAYLLYGLVSEPHAARVLGGHLVYGAHDPSFHPVALAYAAAAGLPLMLSSQRTIQALGAVVLAGCAVAAAFYWDAFLSVWCFFAAAASALILLHFEQARRRRALATA